MQGAKYSRQHRPYGQIGIAPHIGGSQQRTHCVKYKGNDKSRHTLLFPHADGHDPAYHHHEGKDKSRASACLPVCRQDISQAGRTGLQRDEQEQDDRYDPCDQTEGLKSLRRLLSFVRIVNRPPGLRSGRRRSGCRRPFSSRSLRLRPL